MSSQDGTEKENCTVDYVKQRYAPHNIGVGDMALWLVDDQWDLKRR